MEDQQKVFGLLKGLGKGYRSFVTSIMKPPIPSYNDVIQLLQSHENKKSFHCSASTTNEHSAFLLQIKTMENNLETIGREHAGTKSP